MKMRSNFNIFTDLGDSRKRLSPSRIRRRRRLTEERKGSEEYHSEDSLGAGDADVEDSEDDISSSPEEMSSQDEEFSETLRSINSKTRQVFYKRYDVIIIMIMCDVIRLFWLPPLTFHSKMI